MLLLGKLQYYDCFTDDETETQKDKVTCQSHTVREPWSRSLNPGQSVSGESALNPWTVLPSRFRSGSLNFLFQAPGPLLPMKALERVCAPY